MAAPLFLERRRYLRRRIMDGARILPIVGVILWMIPLLWPAQGAAEADRVSTSHALIYLFSVWFALIVACGLLWYRLRDTSGADGTRQERQSDD